MPGRKISRKNTWKHPQKKTETSDNSRFNARSQSGRNPCPSVGEFIFLVAKNVTPSGAFMDWGQKEDLRVPEKEQQIKMEPGKKYLVKICQDAKTRKIYGSTRISANCDKNIRALKIGQQVSLTIHTVTPKGLMAVVDNRYYGRIRLNDASQNVFIGDRCKGYVTGIHDNGKLDLGMRKPKYASAHNAAEVILYRLNQSGGFIPCHDKSSPEEIRRRFSMSKKEFKRAVGNLYKKRMIELKSDGISLAIF